MFQAEKGFLMRGLYNKVFPSLLFGQYQSNWTRVLSALTLSALPILILYLLMSKQFIKGLTAGAVKG